jgi:transcription elongation factor Elf1
MKHGLKCPVCSEPSLVPNRAKAVVVNNKSLRVMDCKACGLRTISVTQFITPEMAEKIVEELEDER